MKANSRPKSVESDRFVTFVLGLMIGALLALLMSRQRVDQAKQRQKNEDTLLNVIDEVYGHA